jgi:hypothetical protein
VLKPCPRCHRHIRADEACPFCRQPASPNRAVVLIGSGALALGAALLLAACYGPPPNDSDLLDDPDSEVGNTHQPASDVRLERLANDSANEGDRQAASDSVEEQVASEGSTASDATDGS